MKTMVENQWTLWSYKPFKDYPSTWYFWINPDGVVKYCRSIEPSGFNPTGLVPEVWLNLGVTPNFMRKFGAKKVTNGYAKMSQEELSQGYLAH